MTEVVWVVAVLSAAVGGGVALSHVLEIPGKHELDERTVATVQQDLYPGFRTMGMLVEPVALVTAVALMILVWGDGTVFWLSVAAAACMVAMGAVFPTVTEPANRIIAEWDRDDLPPEWRHTLHRWELSHATRAVLMLSTATLLSIAAVIDGTSGCC